MTHHPAPAVRDPPLPPALLLPLGLSGSRGGEQGRGCRAAIAGPPPPAAAHHSPVACGAPARRARCWPAPPGGRPPEHAGAGPQAGGPCKVAHAGITADFAAPARWRLVQARGESPLPHRGPRRGPARGAAPLALCVAPRVAPRCCRAPCLGPPRPERALPEDVYQGHLAPGPAARDAFLLPCELQGLREARRRSSSAGLPVSAPPRARPGARARTAAAAGRPFLDLGGAG